MITQAEVEKRILECESDLEEATYEYRSLADNAATAEVTYKVAYARALLSADGTVSQRDARATLATEQQLLGRRIAEARLSSQKEVLGTLRARLDALRTLSANVRRQT